MNHLTSLKWKPALLELILIVLGIYIAFSLDNWNESNNQSKQELAVLVKLKNEISSDIEFLTRQDSGYSKIEEDAEMGIKIFYRAKTISDIDSARKLTVVQLNELFVNTSTYNEMVNSGSMYNLKNKNLQAAIINHYLLVAADKYYIRQVINNQSQLMFHTPEINPYSLLISQLRSPQIDIHSVDTSWINNPKSPTYQAVIKSLNVNYTQNIVYRRSVYKRTIERSKELIATIDEELKNRNR
jgi:hypothetical protein